MSKKSLIEKARHQPGFKVRAYNRCPRGGRPRDFMRKLDLCRVCFRELALQGELPGLVKASW